MARRNRRQRANERRRKMKPYESEPELSPEDSYPPSDDNIYEAQDLQQQNMHNQIEIKVESPNAQHFNDHRRKGKVNTQKLGPYLYRAAQTGDWKAAETALSKDKNIARTEISERGDMALHIAAAAKQTAFVQNLVEHLNTSDLELPNRHGNTAFCIAAVSGVVEIAKVMYEKNKKLPSIRSSIRTTPLEMAIMLGKRKMVEYLYAITPLEDFNAKESMDILVALINVDMYDIALEILNSSRIDISTTNVGRALQALTRKPLQVHGFRGHWMWERLVRTIPYIPHFRRIYNTLQMMRQGRQLVKELWEHIMILPDSNITKLIRKSQILQDAAKLGNFEFLTLITDSYPDLFWEVSKEYHSIFHVALINRQEKVFDLIYQIGAVKDLITLYRDENGNNILHLAGKLAPPSRLKIVSGAAFQMQRELRWFKEVEKIVPSSFLHMKNDEGLTPRELFSVEHEALRQDGEKWMKDTVSYCLVVATLIASVASAAAITIPGGSNQESGTPILLKDRRFKGFVISNVMAMLSSTTSIMIYLSILTSPYPYVEDDFLLTKLIVGLLLTFASLVYMLLTFSATFLLVYNEENQGPLRRLVAGLAFLPIIICLKLYHKFWNVILFSTGRRARLTFQPDKNGLY